MVIQQEAYSKENPPFFSVLILCWNSQDYLHDCLLSLQEQEFKDFEIILVDNGSPQPVSESDWKDFLNLPICFLRLEKNLGFAGGNNYAAGQARGEYLVLLNSDAFPQPDWLSVIHKAALSCPGCSFASRLIMANDRNHLDGEGDNYHATGLVWRRSFGKDLRRASNTTHEVFSACGAAAAYPRQVFEAVHGFDEQYFAYVEDIDLGFRLRLRGTACFYLPGAVVYHVGSGSTKRRSDLSVYYGQRNLVWTFVKDVPAPLIWCLLPGHILANLLQLMLSIFRGQGAVTWRAKRDALAGLGAVQKARREVQKLQKVSVWSLIRVIDWNPVSPITKLLGR